MGDNKIFIKYCQFSILIILDKLNKENWNSKWFQKSLKHGDGEISEKNNTELC
jgi:hypothetical protein